MPKPPRHRLTAAQRETKLANVLRQAALTDHGQATPGAYRSALWAVANRHRLGLPERIIRAIIAGTIREVPWTAPAPPPRPYRFTWARPT